MALYPDLLDENCDDISDWTDGDYGGGVSEVSPAGQFRFDSNTRTEENSYAYRYRTITSPPDKFTIETKIYCDLVGTLSNLDYLKIHYDTATWRFRVFLCSDGLYVSTGDVTQVEVGTNLIKTGASKDWQTWRFQVDKSSGEGAATAEVFLDDVSQGTVDCDYTSPDYPVNGRITIMQIGKTTNDQVSHIEYIKIATGLGEINDGNCFLMFF